MSDSFFTRYELKYLIPYETYTRVASAIAPYVRFDPSGDFQGKYDVISLYFESPDDKIYYETMNKARFRQKLRLRIYNSINNNDNAYFEIKQKYRSVVNKRRTAMKLADAYQFIAEGMNHKRLHHYTTSNQQILAEISSFANHYHLAPKVIVSYNRQAFQGMLDNDLRITFDYYLKCRDDLRLEQGHQGHYFVDPGLVILEVKVSHSVPLWLTRLLGNFRCTLQSVSKYCKSVDYLNEFPKNVAVNEWSYH